MRMRQLFFLVLFIPCLGLWAAPSVERDESAEQDESPFDRDLFPTGDYENYCTACKVEGQQLVCICPKKNGYRQSIDLNLCTENNVSVKLGRLYCTTPVVEEESSETSAEPEEPVDDSLDILNDPLSKLPGGDYREYCRFCDISEGSLNCSCKISSWWFYPSWYEASLPLANCEVPNSVTYAKGMLFCDTAAMLEFFELPRGCRDCTFEHDALTCKCEKTPCGWSGRDIREGHNIRTTTLFKGRSCLGNLKNCNGYLKCEACSFIDYWDQTQYLRPVTGHVKDGKYCYPNMPF